MAECSDLSYEAVRTIWQSHKNMTLANYLSLEEFTPRSVSGNLSEDPQHAREDT